ncbi:unnamed protein product, partial [marine sediment metagenome]
MALKASLEEELAFQKEYLQTMDLLEVASAPQPDIDKFVALAPGYTALLSDQSRYNPE